MVDPSLPRATPLRTPKHWTKLSSHTHLHDKLEPNRETYSDDRHDGLSYAWDSRSHRKGIPAVPVVARTGRGGEGAGAGAGGKESSLSEEEGRKGGAGWKVKRRPMRFVGFDWWDISWWIAILFTVGSVFWCINAILFFCYFSNTTLPYTNTESATAFLGGTTFLFGAYLGWVESMNPCRDADFGWEIDTATRTLIEPTHAQHHALGRNRHHFGSHSPSPSSSSLSSQSPPPAWKWFGLHPSLAYIANSIQLFGASVFFISTLCGLPGVLPEAGASGGPEQGRGTEGLWVGLYWGLQVLGAPCFVFAGVCFCVEVQEKWWKPAPTKIGWQIGFWNAVGGFGFWFCGIFGIWRQTSLANPELYQEYGSALSTFWGSWAFLIGSYVQLWEGINKRS